jgi:hypothetical protein
MQSLAKTVPLALPSWQHLLAGYRPELYVWWLIERETLEVEQR